MLEILFQILFQEEGAKMHSSFFTGEITLKKARKGYEKNR